MIGAIRSEAIKLFSVRVWWVLAIIMFGYVAFTAGLLGGIFGAISSDIADATGGAPVPDGAPGSFSQDALPGITYSVATAIGYVFPLILGVLASTTEVRYQTMTPTFLATPRRLAVLLAKVIVTAVAGALFGVIGLAGSIGAGAPLLAAFDVDTALGDSDTWALAARAVLACALWAVIGVGIGALIPNQIAAIVVIVAFTQFLEPILRTGAAFLPWTAEVGRFLPGAASDALVGASIWTAFGGGQVDVEPLAHWQGGLILIAVALLVTAIGYLTTWRRDVT